MFVKKTLEVAGIGGDVPLTAPSVVGRSPAVEGSTGGGWGEVAWP